MSSSIAALSYHEPDIVTILILTSFLLLENVVNWAVDRLLFCGLLGQIAIGIAWGRPGANWLSANVQGTIMQIGYLGLILLVFEGGLSTDLKTLKSNLFLSSLVALTGVSAPIALSFLLPTFVDGVTPVQAFAAGAALCSTSLGTTFTILSTSGLSASRLGVVLSSAAMMDDIVGLVMSGIIASLGTSSDFSAVTVIRPVFTSIAFAVILPLVCTWIFKPLTILCYSASRQRKEGRLHQWLNTENAALVLHALVLSGLVAAASYAGTSNLFAAYLAGAIISWWDDLCKTLRVSNASEEGRSQVDGNSINIHSPVDVSHNGNASAQDDQLSTQAAFGGNVAPENRAAVNADSAHSPAPSSHDPHARLTGCAIFEKYYGTTLQTILKPFFFASIGFAIPISQMFTGPVIWRGLVYTLLMIIAKLICGVFLVRFAGPIIPMRPLTKRLKNSLSGCWSWPSRTAKSTSRSSLGQNSDVQNSPTQNSPAETQTTRLNKKTQLRSRARIQKPTSLYPAALLGGAMVARGEIGFLISSVAESDGVFGSTEEARSSELFLIVTWAILLCTLLGPVVVGLMVKRVKRLQATERGKQTGKEDPLGIWGVIHNTRTAT